MMDLREIDRLVAEKVMGWKRLTNPEAYPPYYKDGPYANQLTPYWYDGDNKATACATDYETCIDCRHEEPAWSPTEDIAAAWAVVEKLLAEGWRVQLSIYEDNDCHVCMWRLDDEQSISVDADTAPKGFCLAALKAKGVEVPA